MEPRLFTHGAKLQIIASKIKFYKNKYSHPIIIELIEYAKDGFIIWIGVLLTENLSIVHWFFIFEFFQNIAI